MGRPPIGKTAMSGAERQRKYLDRLLAGNKADQVVTRLRRELAALKDQLADARSQRGTADQQELVRLREELAISRAALAQRPAMNAETERLQQRCRQLEAEAQFANRGFDLRQMRKLKALAHSDNVQHREAKAQMDRFFVEVNAILEPVARNIRHETEMRQRRQQMRAANSARSKAAWAKRRAKKEEG